MSTSGQPKMADLVFEGGGVKGIGLAGAYSALEEQGWTFSNVAGTSAGAITAALVAAGYTAEELKKEILELDFKAFMDKAWEDKFKLRTISILKDLGIYEGKFFEQWMAGKLAAKGVETFGDLIVDPDEPDARYRFRLHVVVSDVTQRRMLVLPDDAESLGVAPEDMSVAKAVRMSMSIPFFFEPVEWHNPKTNRVHVITDGGMLSNYPVWLFDCPPGEEPEWPTFGMMLVEPNPRESVAERLPAPEKTRRGAKGVVEFVSALAHTMMEFHDRMYVEKAEFARTIPIPTLGVGTTEFDLERERALELYDSGHASAEAFLATWDFDAYIEKFRSGRKVGGRRDELAKELSAEHVT